MCSSDLNRINEVKFTLHNVHAFNGYVNTLNTLKKDKEMYKDMVRKKLGKNVIIALEFLEYGIEHGYDKAINKYRNYLYQPKEEPISSKSLLRF